MIGGIYRDPGYKISEFMEIFDSVMSQIVRLNLPCSVGGYKQRS